MEAVPTLRGMYQSSSTHYSIDLGVKTLKEVFGCSNRGNRVEALGSFLVTRDAVIIPLREVARRRLWSLSDGRVFMPSSDAGDNSVRLGFCTKPVWHGSAGRRARDLVSGAIAMFRLHHLAVQIIGRLLPYHSTTVVLCRTPLTTTWRRMF
jgi:hypothetical protein